MDFQLLSGVYQHYSIFMLLTQDLGNRPYHSEFLMFFIQSKPGQHLIQRLIRFLAGNPYLG